MNFPLFFSCTLSAHVVLRLQHPVFTVYESFLIPFSQPVEATHSIQYGQTAHTHTHSAHTVTHTHTRQLSTAKQGRGRTSGSAGGSRSSSSKRERCGGREGGKVKFEIIRVDEKCRYDVGRQRRFSLLCVPINSAVSHNHILWAGQWKKNKKTKNWWETESDALVHFFFSPQGGVKKEVYFPAHCAAAVTLHRNISTLLWRHVRKPFLKDPQ